MTEWWLDLLGYAWELVALGFIGLVGAALWLGGGVGYSCAPVEAEDDEGDEGDEQSEDDTAAWDRGHDEYNDREMGVA